MLRCLELFSMVLPGEIPVPKRRFLRMRSDRRRVAAWFVAISGFVGCAAVVARVSGNDGDTSARDTILARAICPIVYPVDETPGSHGYQYAFYGNAFFISREGYLITAAHVLHSFSNGGQPHILVQRGDAPPQLLKAEVVAMEDGPNVVGFIEGQWLHPAVGLAAHMEPGATSIGAAVPIRYAIPVLLKKGIIWEA